MARAERRQFLNATQGWLGYTHINQINGIEEGRSVAPGEVIWLTDDEIDATIQSQSSPQNNPFSDHHRIVHHDMATGEVVKEYTGARFEEIKPAAPKARAPRQRTTKTTTRRTAAKK